jgi:hypothetical protein
MNKESAGVLQVVRRRAATWLDELTDQFRAMLDFMPRLRDAIDADDLPIPFILRRGWERAIRSGRHERAKLQGEQSICGVTPRTSAGRPEHAAI